MSTYNRGSEDLYAILSAHYPVLNSTPEEKQELVSKKRSWDCSISQSLQMGSSKTMCSGREIHVWTERRRRKTMSNMLNTLQSLLPGLHGKIDKTRIIDEAINYIKTLQDTLKDLQARKSEREASSPKTSSLSMVKSKDSRHVCDVQIPLSVKMVPTSCIRILGSNVVGNHAFTTIWSPQQTGFLPKLFFILDANQLEIVDCTINNVGCNTLYTLHVMTESSSQQPAAKAFRCAINSIITSHQE